MEIKDERICGSQTYLRGNHKKAKGITTDNYVIINEDLSAYLFFLLLSNWIKKVHNFIIKPGTQKCNIFANSSTKDVVGENYIGVRGWHQMVIWVTETKTKQKNQEQ